METTLLQYPPLTLFITGLAFTLENPNLVIPKNRHKLLRVHLFSLESKKAQEYLRNILGLVDKSIKTEKELEFLALGFLRSDYYKKTDSEIEKYIKELVNFFDINRQNLIDNVFDFSKLNSAGKALGEKVYKKYNSVLDEIVEVIYNSKPEVNTNQDCGIIFIEK